MTSYLLLIYSGNFSARLSRGCNRRCYKTGGDARHEVYKITDTGTPYFIDVSFDDESVRFYTVESNGREVDASLEFTDAPYDGPISLEQLYKNVCQCVRNEPIRHTDY